MSKAEPELLDGIERETHQVAKGATGLWRQNIKIVRRIIVAVIGTTVLLIGIVLIVLPGPAFIVIPVGLGILATEFAWARRWLKKVKQVTSSLVSRVKGS